MDHVRRASGLLALPNELLRRIYEYLDWDVLEHLTPYRPDILQLSLTCRHVRLTVLPILFRCVRLKFRWVDGALVEPALFRLRWEHSHLARYIRYVYIETQFGQFADPQRKLKSFHAPKGFENWLDPRPPDLQDEERNAHSQRVINIHKGRVDAVVEELLGPTGYDVLSRPPAEHTEEPPSHCLPHFPQTLDGEQRRPTGNASGDLVWQGRLAEHTFYDAGREEEEVSERAETRRRQQIEARNRRFELDALKIVLLCLPPTLENLIFESLPTDRMDVLQDAFTCHVCSLALRIYGNRLQTLSVIMPLADQEVSRAARRGEHSFSSMKTAFKELVGVRRLALATFKDKRREGPNRHIHVRHFASWLCKPLCGTVTSLELWNMDIYGLETLEFVKSFECLTHLALSHIRLRPARRHAERPTEIDWLHFLISVRRHDRALRLNLRHLEIWRPLGSETIIPRSALTWLMAEAVPVGMAVDFDRETRLTEDFKSFLQLWLAEDGPRGEEAANARKDVKLDGTLVDQAMSSRGRTWENMRL